MLIYFFNNKIMVRKIMLKTWWYLLAKEKGDPANKWAWRPPSLMGVANTKLRRKWYKPVWREEFERAIGIVLWLDLKGIKFLLDDKKVPISLKIIAKEVIHRQKWFAWVNSLTDRLFWKAVQKVENKNLNVNTKLDEEKKIELKKLLKANL